ncbi:MAG: bile acid:sodium symporter [Spirochaetales bacterium]|uniref:Bile acid:sodium symporter n=1 Tax=Candidatus Thalassospirochaeta sargassi TaxID=3119039 RepID=A0AAJ1IFP8_9SPIO|nr:bile acid:sodium symporter [Spirochaetales bacterium]
MNFLKNNWFIIGIFAALAAGFLFSDAGVFLNTGSYFSTSLVVLLFIITGLKLPVNSIKYGLKDVRVHIYIQLFIFIFVPLYFFLTSMLFESSFSPQIIVGIYALAVLPCTISSCIVFTQSAGGNVVATMFNAALANIAGVFVSPLLLSLLLRTSAEVMPAAELLATFRKLALIMLLPIGAGQVLRRWISGFVDSRKRELGVVSNIFILLILYFAFSASAAKPSFVQNLKSMALPYVYLALSFIVLNAIATGGAVLLRFRREDRITVTFTAPKKTLAMGVPLLTTYFASDAELLGAALLPLIFYHPWQLLVSGIIQERVRKRSMELEVEN